MVPLGYLVPLGMSTHHESQLKISVRNNGHKTKLPGEMRKVP